MGWRRTMNSTLRAEAQRLGVGHGREGGDKRQVKGADQSTLRMWPPARCDDGTEEAWRELRVSATVESEECGVQGLELLEEEVVHRHPRKERRLLLWLHNGEELRCRCRRLQRAWRCGCVSWRLGTMRPHNMW
jgi:hypothetical protein